MSLVVLISLSVTLSLLLFGGTRDRALGMMLNVKELYNSLLKQVTVGILTLVTLRASRLTDSGTVGGATLETVLLFLCPSTGKKWGNFDTLMVEIIALL